MEVLLPPFLRRPRTPLLLPPPQLGALGLAGDGLGQLSELDAADPLVGCEAARRTPTLSFRVADWAPRRVAEALAGDGICVWTGNYFAYELMRRLDLDDSGGAVRVGILHYNTAEEIDRLLASLERLAARAPA